FLLKNLCKYFNASAACPFHRARKSAVGRCTRALHPPPRRWPQRPKTSCLTALIRNAGTLSLPTWPSGRRLRSPAHTARTEIRKLARAEDSAVIKAIQSIRRPGGVTIRFSFVTFRFTHHFF